MSDKEDYIMIFTKRQKRYFQPGFDFLKIKAELIYGLNRFSKHRTENFSCLTANDKFVPSL